MQRTPVVAKVVAGRQQLGVFGQNLHTAQSRLQFCTLLSASSGCVQLPAQQTSTEQQFCFFYARMLIFVAQQKIGLETAGFFITAHLVVPERRTTTPRSRVNCENTSWGLVDKLRLKQSPVVDNVRRR